VPYELSSSRFDYIESNSIALTETEWNKRLGMSVVRLAVQGLRFQKLVRGLRQDFEEGD